MKKSPLAVCCPDPHPNAGSEPGKAFAWTRALATRFEVHVFCTTHAAERCRLHPDAKEWIFHDISHPYPKNTSALSFYRWYLRWCHLLIEKLQASLLAIQPVGLHHITLGSYRVLPRYDRLSVPFTLGPLGGGEFVPASFALTARLPAKHLLVELLRPFLNQLCVRNPASSQVLRHARHAFATTPQTARLLQQGGALSVSTIFPDVFVPRPLKSDPLTIRRHQMQELSTCFRLFFSGRALWWKGGHLAIQVLRAVRERGLPASLTFVTQGPAAAAWKSLAQRAGLEKFVHWHPFVARDQLLEMQSHAHAFVYPTMHDSSSSAIPEAYSTGLPSVTLGIGGLAMAVGPGTGLNAPAPTAQEWIAQAAQQVTEWVNRPEHWFNACQAAWHHSQTFTSQRIENAIVDYCR